MGITREFVTPQIEVVTVETPLTIEDAQEWANARLAHIRDLGNVPYGLLIDLRTIRRIPLQIMMVMVSLVRRAGETEGYVALVGATTITNSMADAVMRVVPKRLERFQLFEGYDPAFAWLQSVLA